MAGPVDKDEKQSLLLQQLSERVGKLASDLEKARLADYVTMLERPKRMLWGHFLGGIARGFGIAVGFTLLTSTAIYLLQALGALNLPIVGDYIADIIQHVQASLDNRRY
ncbi:hypothetical protein J31TS4_29760 [Paenibacillus sp. J31TS4]|uniref:DUF5665 domain-containing protein n=1 Tax=Paenibacillus sp. J31TS4 TaxID=2807195 RepID=UPI001B0A26ED|nr:DUF5665 domain-containing protein [Paenibacillus sp. J31TS4]GIP39696.1 hypothetical protein J31TS4_29760 [Paenibacillus sp. J31TS4]